MSEKSVDEQIKQLIQKFGGWRGERLAQVQDLIKQADPEVIEDVKWKTPSNPDGVPVWYHDGMICTAETYKKHLRIAFSKGPELDDPKGLINSYRAMIIHEGDEVDEEAFVALVRHAVALNQKGK